MDYDKIEQLISSKGVSKMTFYKAINLTHTGFARMMKNKSLSVDTLEKIAEYFNIPVSTFFSESGQKVATKEDLQQKIAELYEENRQLMKENKKLMEDIAAIKESQAIPANSATPKLTTKR